MTTCLAHVTERFPIKRTEYESLITAIAIAIDRNCVIEPILDYIEKYELPDYGILEYCGWH